MLCVRLENVRPFSISNGHLFYLRNQTYVTLAGEGEVKKHPVSVFNIVVNICEVCGEEEKEPKTR